MDFRRLNDAELVDFTKNLVDQLSAHEVTSLDNTLADALAAGIAPVNTAFESSIEESVQRIAVKESGIADKQTRRFDLETRIAAVRNYLSAVTGPKKDYEICGFDFPKSASPVVANDPTELSGAGTSNGVNRLSFKGNNKPSSVVYEIWRREGDEGPWGIIAATKKQVYTDTPVTPGQYYEYKVRAVASKSTSNFSNSAVVYGVL